VGGVVPLLRRDKFNEKESSFGVGDISAQASYEALPQWGYSVWQPTGFLVAQLSFPTGTSRFEVPTISSQVRGRGLYRGSLGLVLTKNWAFFDATAGFFLDRPFARSLTLAAGGAYRTEPGWGTRGLWSFGWSPIGTGLRLGASLAYVSEGEGKTSGAFESVTPGMTLWTPSLSLAYLLSADQSILALYSDEGLLPLSSANTPLYRGVAVSYQYRFPR
jgi:hypothetical protein